MLDDGREDEDSPVVEVGPVLLFVKLTYAAAWLLASGSERYEASVSIARIMSLAW